MIPVFGKATFNRTFVAGGAIRRRERGAALLVALILLVVITLVGLAAIGTTILQNKATSNQYDRHVAFQAAEAAMRQAQIAITTAAASQPAPAGFFDCSSPTSAGPAVNVCLADAFHDANVPATRIISVPASAFSAGPAAAMQPQYIVQYLGQFQAPSPKEHQIGGPKSYGASSAGEMADYYRITARSGDPSLVTGRAIVTLQSTFRN